MALTGTNRKLPPGPGGPALVQSLRYYRDPYGFLHACQRKYGDWFTVKQIPCGTIVYVADPEAVRLIFADPGTHIAGAINDYMAPVLGQGLLLLDGEAHARERRWLAPALASERIRGVAAEIEALTESEIAMWKVGVPFALRPRFELLTLRIILRVLFGAAAAARLAELMSKVIQLKGKDITRSVMAALPFGLATWKLSGDAAHNAEAIDRMLYAELAARREGTVANEGMLAGMLAGSQATDKNLRDQLMTLIFAGHETVAATLAWTFERVLRHPTVYGKLRTADEHYSEAVLLETMRQRSTIGDVARELTSPLETARQSLPVGTRVCPSIVLVHMRPDLFPEPEAFRPERFLDAKPKPWMYLPFGGGVRHCLGAAFAMMEMLVILRTVLARTALRATDPAPERGVSNGVTIYPHKGAMVVVEARR